MRRNARRLLAGVAFAAAFPSTGCQSLDNALAPGAGRSVAAPAASATSANDPTEPPPASSDTPPSGEEARRYKINPGVTGYSHILGWVAQRFVYPQPLVERALWEAMSDMGIHSVHRKIRHDDMIVLAGLLYDGRAIYVEVEPQGPATGVRMRIDTYGDEPKSKMLMDRISIRLSTLPQSLTPPFDPRALSDSATHRGMEIQGYRGAPLR